MLLCDIGNTTVSIYDGKQVSKKLTRYFKPSTIKEEICYICVNPALKESIRSHSNWIDLASRVDYASYYPTMGIDRIMACEAVSDGVVVDAGSAITVDLVRGGKFEGGFIYPGVVAMQNAYKKISSQLDSSFNFELSLDKMPKNTQDAITYGFIAPLVKEVLSHKLSIYLCGGYADDLASFFSDAKVDELLVFKGMQKFIRKASLC